MSVEPNTKVSTFVGPVRLDGLSDGGSRITKATVSALTDRWMSSDRPVLFSLGRTDGRALFGHLVQGPVSDAIGDFCDWAENAGQPGIAILDGVVAGDALIMALAAQGRVASHRSRLVFDHVRIGAIPGHGSACRLTRLVGAAEALRILSRGLVVTATEALAMGLVDYVVDTDAHPLGAAAEEFAAEMIANGAALPATQREKALRDGRAHLTAVAEFRKSPSADPVYQNCLADCVEACLLLPGEQALFYEASRQEVLTTRPEAKALQNLSQAEDSAQTIPEALRNVPTVGIATLGIWGTVPQHTGPVVLNALSRQIGVILADSDQVRLVSQLKEVAARQEISVQDGKMTAAARDEEWSRLTPSLNAEDLAHLPLVLIGPDAAVPHELRPGPQLQDGVTRTVLSLGRQDLPDGVYRLVLSHRAAELALPSGASTETAAQAVSFLRQMGLIVVLTGPQSPTGIAGRLAAAGNMAVRSLALMGVPYAEIVSALATAGLPRPRPIEEKTTAAPRAMPAKDIVARWLAALSNEGVRQLSAGLARSTGDIDLVAVHGLGVPRYLGGPMHWADTKGALIVRRDLSDWSADGAIWSPHPGWDAFVSLGRVKAGVGPS